MSDHLRPGDLTSTAGPFLVGAFICFDWKQDGGYVIDRVAHAYTTRGSAGERLKFVVLVAGGIADGVVRVRVVGSRGTTPFDLFDDVLTVSGTGNVGACVQELDITPDSEGTVWFDVYLGDVQVTRVPLNVTRFVPEVDDDPRLMLND